MQQAPPSNSKRIAKNTLMLYFRMFIMMAVSLYTSRVVLHVLGESDYGIYNIVGGIVILFSFLNSALLQATQRFLNFELGKGDEKGLRRIFCMSMNSYLLVSFAILVLSETIGLWFVNTQLSIPADRMVAANWVYQFTIVAFIINLIRVPYNATIIAYERMGFYAYISLVEVVLKLLFVFILYAITWDKLSFFALFYAVTPLLINYIYKKYCNRNFRITLYRRIWDAQIFRQLFTFSSWSLLGSIAHIIALQGLNILVNIFYGVSMNAAFGIANQLSAKVTQFVSNFQLAFSPQITKKYAAKDFEGLFSLIIRSSKFSYYLIIILTLPLIIKMDDILSLWLIDVPKYTTIFSQLILVFIVIESITAPLPMYIQAVGEIKNYQILMGLLILMVFPLSLFALTVGFPVYSILVVRIIVSIISTIARCVYVKYKYDFPIILYIHKVFLPIAFVTILTIPIPLYLDTVVSKGLFGIIFVTLATFFTSAIVIISIGISKQERSLLISYLLKKWNR